MPESQPRPDKKVSIAVERRIRWDALAAIIASLVGLLALVVAGYTAHIQRQQVQAQVWPYLLVGNDDNAQSIDVYNKGVGPAIVRSAQVFVDGKPQTDWRHVLDALGVSLHSYSQSTLNQAVLSPGETVQMIRIPDKDAYKRFKAAAVDHLTLVNVCFCSTLGECWMYSDKHPVGYKAIAQLVKPVDRCPRLPAAEVFNN